MACLSSVCLVSQPVLSQNMGRPKQQRQKSVIGQTVNPNYCCMRKRVLVISAQNHLWDQGLNMCDVESLFFFFTTEFYFDHMSIKTTLARWGSQVHVLEFLFPISHAGSSHFFKEKVLRMDFPFSVIWTKNNILLKQENWVCSYLPISCFLLSRQWERAAASFPGHLEVPPASSHISEFWTSYYLFPAIALWPFSLPPAVHFFNLTSFLPSSVYYRHHRKHLC